MLTLRREATLGCALSLVMLALALRTPLQAGTPLGRWRSTGSVATSRILPTATLLLSGQVLVAGGQTASAERYDPATDTWFPTGSMTDARYGHTATLLQTGKVLVAGGATPPVPQSRPSCTTRPRAPGPPPAA
jgi:hypothetical protein